MTNRNNTIRATGTFFRLSIAFLLSAVFANAEVGVMVELPMGYSFGLNAQKGALDEEITTAIEAIAEGNPADQILVTWTTPEGATGVRRRSRRLPSKKDDEEDPPDAPDPDPEQPHEFVDCPVCPEGKYCITYCDEGDSSGIMNAVAGRVAIMKAVRAAISTVCDDRDCKLVTGCVACCADYELSVQVSAGLPPPEPTIPPLPDCPNDGKCTATPTLMHMQYTAKPCADGGNSQVDKFSCKDHQTDQTKGLPTIPWIVAREKGKDDKIYHSGWVPLGQSYDLVHPDGPTDVFDKELEILIFKDNNTDLKDSNTELLQELIFQGNCDVMTACEDTYGASQLTGWKQVSKEGEEVHVKCNECDPNWCPNNGTLPEKEKPFGMEMLFIGGEECQNDNDQDGMFSCVKPHNHKGPPEEMGEPAWITVTKTGDSSKKYFTGLVNVGERYRLAHPNLNHDFEEGLTITIHDVDHNNKKEHDKRLQVVHFQTSGDKPLLHCFNKFGASQVVGWESHKQGVVQCSDCPL